MNTNRFFLVADNVYESIRADFDTLWEHPSNGTETCMPPVSKAVRNASGVIVCPVLRETCEWAEVATILAQLLSDGIIVETDEAEYIASLPTTKENEIN
jgi:hypothetical protein